MRLLERLNQDLSENVIYNYPGCDLFTFLFHMKYHPGFNGIPHWHDDVEFSVALDGEITQVVNGELITLHTGEGILFNSRQLHYSYLTEGHRTDNLCIRFNQQMLCTSPFFESTYILPVTQNRQMPYLKLTQEVEWQRQVIEDLQELYRLSQTENANLAIHGVLCLLWSRIYENMPDSAARSQGSAADLESIEDMMLYIERRYAEKLTLGQIAEAGHVCESKCCRLFGKYLHKTPNTYLTHYRLGKAAELLVTTEQSVTEVAFTCGFSGASYFAETFRKCFDVTPKEYRARNRR